ncbi:MAG TPA: alpha amylase C-terminal domain-containing protein [Bacteroidales bacterium]|nr:alpha amylase C-terminal domain-containing protein [Bacteroidales bacterium]HOH22930.1 alpha amylase C-terminal domain-containing protein [Bacteroidales bacterium]HPZ02937.1 alpha amylase C-terminal domain-containing protein [Bacteroidales bacterium]HQB74181.1 alpha amylase C-terminal domain-containing protein [Bacteroidales bacterium]
MKRQPLVELDPYLKPFERKIVYRSRRRLITELEITQGKFLLKDKVNNHLYYGLHKTERDWVFREKAPNANAVYLIGDFSYWQVLPQYQLKPIGNGDWEIRLPLSFLSHGDLYRVWMVWSDGADDRLPAYLTKAYQDQETKQFSAQVWDPPQSYEWRATSPKKPDFPLIYEAHIGMSSQEPEVSTYIRFTQEVLPRIAQLGYNTIQLMAIQEHPYYGSFGYQVSNYFAPSSRFGTPEELKALIDAAHELNISVILDLVHSHAVSNVKEGIGRLDGSETLYFHGGEKGQHPVWDSRCFNYGKMETLFFLLSNLKYWLEEFRFDGFRFDGITSMCYWNHGIGVDFLNYSQYFDDNVDWDALTYLQLANMLIKQVNPNAFTIAEDVSGIPGLAFPVEKGGIGFDYRMSMGIADFWGKIIKEIPDEEWHVGDIFFKMTDKRVEEQTISYAESHDQAMVGDKSLIFRLIDEEMYTGMEISNHSLIVDRGVALHKMIRLVTLTLSQGGYLNFMGNEFGHPEWIDFPREGNNWSCYYARRQWNLVDDENLKYTQLNKFDQSMIELVNKYPIFLSNPRPIIRNTEEQVLVYIRGELIFVFNFHPTQSYTDYEVYAPKGEYKVILNSDDELFGGFNQLDPTVIYKTFPIAGVSHLRLYIPARSCFVLAPQGVLKMID